MTKTPMSKGRGRPRKGTLEFRGAVWYGRVTVTVEGEGIRKWVDLGTDNKAVARRKLARLVAEQAKAEPPAFQEMRSDAAREETVAEAAQRIVKHQGTEGLKTWKERLARLERYAMKELGPMLASTVRPIHIRETLSTAGASGLSKQSVQHLKNDLSGVFGDLWRDELISENPVARVKLPKNLRTDKRPRIIIPDDMFRQFMACTAISDTLRLKSLASRAFGGMRTSDLHAWDWSHIDVAGWKTAYVYRPKTDGADETQAELEQLIMPDVLRGPLKAHWEREKEPKVGPVFPVERGERVGKNQVKRSHARELRAALWTAGVHMPLDGFPEALARQRTAADALEAARAAGAKGTIRLAQQAARLATLSAQALDAIQTDTPRSRRADFHSFRRAFNTALGAAGVNVQQAMALAGHKDTRTHMRYVDLSQGGPLETPAAALPVLFLPTVVGNILSVPEPENDNPAVFTGDPNENRTRVIGVRGRRPNR